MSLGSLYERRKKTTTKNVFFLSTRSGKKGVWVWLSPQKIPVGRLTEKKQLRCPKPKTQNRPPHLVKMCKMEVKNLMAKVLFLSPQL